MLTLGQASDRRFARREKTELLIGYEQRKLGEGKLTLLNISAEGCMVTDCPAISRGERIELILPLIGRVDCHLVWRVEERAGLHFERVLRMKEYLDFLDTLPKHRPA